MRFSVPAQSPADIRILAVEDNVVNQRVISSLLTRLGIASRVVNGGAAALAVLGDDGGGFHLVLMDCQMPDMDGFATTGLWRAREHASSLTSACRLSHLPRMPCPAIASAVLPPEWTIT